MEAVNCRKCGEAPFIGEVDGVWYLAGCDYIYSSGSTRDAAIAAFHAAQKPRIRVTADGWIRHFGDPCPVDSDVRVDVKWPDGGMSEGFPAKFWEDGSYDWWQWQGDADQYITHWRYAR